ncbi:hypothetical protein K438DRAFT_2017974 [Mycena galopus ATCC 62051]|nr:hypothetical protein K438DRAFT_2017974 [Mycena galopus ATCC 62051]
MLCSFPDTESCKPVASAGRFLHSLTSFQSTHTSTNTLPTTAFLMSAYQSNSTGGVYQYDPYDNPRTPKRTPMACGFCRARKLKCDGMRPQCGNCNRRGFACSYTPVAAQASK